MITVKVTKSRFVKTDRKICEYRNILLHGGVWEHPIWFDPKSNTYRVFFDDGVATGLDLELSDLPPLGDFEFETKEPLQYPRERPQTVHKMHVR